MARIQLTNAIVLPNNPNDLWLEEVRGVNDDNPTVVQCVVVSRSNAGSGRQAHITSVIEVRDGQPGDPGADPPVPPNPGTESYGITRGPVSYAQGIVAKRVIVAGALTGLLDAWAAAGNGANLTRAQRLEQRKQAALTFLLGNGIIDASLTGIVQ